MTDETGMLADPNADEQRKVRIQVSRNLSSEWPAGSGVVVKTAERQSFPFLSAVVVRLSLLAPLLPLSLQEIYSEW